MRSKIDVRLEHRGKEKKKRPYGGKAMRRLFAYLCERDPALGREAVAMLAVPKAAQPTLGLVDGPSASKSPRTAKQGPRGRAPPPAAKRFAARIAKAASVLASDHAAAAGPQGAAALAALGATWQPLGPSRIPNGQTYGTNKIDVIGRVSSIAVDPGNPRHLLLGAAGGGIWESKDTGATWAPRSDQMPSNAIGAIAFDPSDPSKAYAGSGEGNFYFNLGAGIYSSTDGGQTWRVLSSAPFVGSGFFDLVVDPKNPMLLYAATIDSAANGGGFYKSTNGGASWSMKRAGTCWDICVHPNGGTVELLAAFVDGLFVSTDAGNSFSPVALPSKPASNWARLGVDRVATSPDVTYLFGAVDKAPHLWRRAAGTWTKITSLPPVDKQQPWTGQAQYDWYVAAPPDNMTQVYLGAIDIYRGTLTGSTWKFKNVSTQGPNSIHPDQHCLAFSPDDSKIIYVGSDGGIFRSADSGASWAPLNDGLGITEIEYLAGDPSTSQWLMAGTQDNGTLRFSGSSTWDQIAEGDGGDCGVNPENPDEVYHSFYFDGDTGKLGFAISSDKGKHWTDRDLPIESAQFYPPVEASGSTVAVGALALFVSRDRGGKWQRVPLGLTSKDSSTAMRLTDANTTFVGTSFGRFVRVDWTGTSWKAKTLTSPTPRYISGIAVESSNIQRVWVTVSQMQQNAAMVYRSDDGGSSWSACRTGLPAIPMNAVAIDPADSDRAWVAADVGVYETRDGGKNWASLSAGLPNAMAADLLFHANDRTLICGTRNRGAWVMKI
jgi:photosystem II stability/assembly factor-like uncharacterized protein